MTESMGEAPPAEADGRSRRSSMRFDGLIAGFGTTTGHRIVLGLWTRSPLGRFADVMMEDASGHRVLFAPSSAVADLVGETYRFDEVRVVPVDWRMWPGDVLTLRAGELAVSVRIGPRSWLGRLLRLQPRRLSSSTAWLAAIDPLARLVVRGAGTAGSAGGGRREYYGVSDARSIASVEVLDGDRSWGDLAPLSPPVRFGFAQTPTEPTVVRVTTTLVG